MKKIIFLDFDGVLNTPEDAYTGKLTDVLVAKLSQFCLEHDFEVCFTTTWRNLPEHNTIEALRDLLVSYGMDAKVKLAGMTPNLEENYPNPYTKGGNFPLRGVEVNDWLVNHPDVTSYVLLDDVPQLFINNQMDKLVCTDLFTGLTDLDLAHILEKIKLQENEKKPLPLKNAEEVFIENTRLLEIDKKKASQYGFSENGGFSSRRDPSSKIAREDKLRIRAKIN